MQFWLNPVQSGTEVVRPLRLSASMQLCHWTGNRQVYITPPQFFDNDRVLDFVG